MHVGGSDSGTSVGNDRPYFKLMFRGEATTPIYPTDDVFAVQAALETLPTIGSVVVSFKNAKRCVAQRPRSDDNSRIFDRNGRERHDRQFLPHQNGKSASLRLVDKTADLSIIFAEDTPANK